MAEAAGAKALDWSQARRMVAYVRWHWIAAAVALSLLIGIAGQAFPWLQFAAIDRYFAPAPGSVWAALSADERLAMALGLAWAYLGVAVAAFGAQVSFELIVAWIGQRVLQRLRGDLFAKLQRLPVAYFDSRPAGQIIARVVSDVETVNGFVSRSLVTLVQSVFVLTAVAGYMLFLNWRLALIALVMVPVVFWIFRFFSFKLRIIHGEFRARFGALTGWLNEHLVGMWTAQQHNSTAVSQTELERLNGSVLQSQLTAFKWTIALGPVTGFLTNLTLAATLWWGAGLSAQGLVSLGTLVAFTQYLRNFFQPLQELSALPDSFPAALASAERIFGLLDEAEAVSDAPGARSVEKLQGAIAFEQVSFAYKGESWVVKGVDLEVAPGESVALVGATGSGKTTVVNLVARFYDAQRGVVRVDGVPVKEYAQRSFRSRIGLVLQDALLFSGTIESNLRMGNDQVPMERLIEVCKLVGVHDFVASLPQGYQTPVKERGATLSAGQKQLLAFARALVPNPDILLLDEATANVDSDSERKIQTALEALMHGRTSLVVAHRLSTVQHCDRVVVMSHGKVVEQGPPGELLRRDGHYAKLHALHAAEAGG